jgi:aminoglycoside phosphotransferase
LRLANGNTAFVKALGINIHEFSVQLYRTEAATMAHLPADLPVPRLLDVYDDGNWVALVYEDIEGHHPTVPWRLDELGRVEGMLATLTDSLHPSPWRDAPTFAEVNPTLMEAWRKLALERPSDIDPRLNWHLDRLIQERTDLAAIVSGDALLHTDIRSDNILLTSSGGVVLLDWGWTCRGASWIDVVLFAMTVNAGGGADAEQLLIRHPAAANVPAGAIDAVLLAIAANYWVLSGLPEQPALPGMRAYQRAYAEATLQWVDRRRRSRLI